MSDDECGELVSLFESLQPPYEAAKRQMVTPPSGFHYFLWQWLNEPSFTLHIDLKSGQDASESRQEDA